VFLSIPSALAALERFPSCNLETIIEKRGDPIASTAIGSW
jgi:hypothetical protein